MRDYQPLRITEVRRETPEAISVTLHIPRAAARGIPLQAGPASARARSASAARSSGARIRSACAPGEAGLRIAIKRIAEGRFSNWANDTLAAGGTLDAMPPAGGSCCPRATGPRGVVAFAAGAGITPILAMVEHVLAAEPATSFTLVYGNRSARAASCFARSWRT